MSIPLDDIKEYLTNLAGDIRLIRGSLYNLNYSSTAADGWKFNADGTFTLNNVSGLTRPSYSTCFETAARFTATTSGAGEAATFGVNGAAIVLGAGATRFLSLDWQLATATTGLLYKGNPVFGGAVQMVSVNAGVGPPQMCWGLGAITTAGAAGITFTSKHIGFKVIDVSGTPKLHATVADGTTETATVLATVANSDVIEWYVITVSDTSADFYYRMNGGVMNGPTTITTNIPASSTSENILRLASSNHNQAGVSEDFNAMSLFYRR